MLPLSLFCTAGTVGMIVQTAGASFLSSQLSAMRRADQTSLTGTLCNADRSVCVPQATRNILIRNPFDIMATAAGSVGDVSWELDDHTGQKLISGKASDDLNWSMGSNPTLAEAFHMSGFVFVLPKSSIGELRLSPARYNKQGVASKLPELAIPVRFGSTKSTISLVVPKDYNQFYTEAGNVMPNDVFTPMSPFIQESLSVMHVNDVVWTSAEAAAEKASVVSKVPVRIINFAVRDGTGYVDLNLNDPELVGAWAGISFAVAVVETLVEKDLIQFPEIHNVVFSWPPPAAGSPSPRAAEARWPTWSYCTNSEPGAPRAPDNHLASRGSATGGARR